MSRAATYLAPSESGTASERALQRVVPSIYPFDAHPTPLTSQSDAGEYHIINGRINDIAWDGDSQRLIAVGDGKERFGHCITADSGNSVGEITGHSSQINSVSIRQQRPLRAATGSDDTNLVFYHGAPFKYNTSLRGHHNRFIYGVAFSPDGSTLVSTGSDRKIWLYDGKTGEARGQIGEGVHTGSIFGVSWAKDSKRFVTASADQTVKIWDAEAGKVVQSWRMGEEGTVSIPDQQVGVVWPSGRSDGLVISLNLDGDLNYLAEGTPKPTRVIQGHQKNITAVATSSAGSNKGTTLWTGSYDGRICGWDVHAGLAETADGTSHTNQVSGLTATSSRIYSVGWDDTLRSIDAASKTFLGSSTKTRTGQPRGIASAAAGEAIYVVTAAGIEIYDQHGAFIHQTATKSTPTCIAAAPTTGLLAIGFETHDIQLYTTNNTSPPSLSPTSRLTDSTAPITALSFTPSGALLAAGNALGKITVYATADTSVVTDRWSAHTARISSLAWNDAGTHALSGALDTNVFLWSLASPGKRVKAANAHKDGVNGVAWLGEDKVVSAGGDAAVKVWRVGLV